MLPEFKFHHIGVAVNNIETTAQYYLNAGYEKSENAIDTTQNINLCFLSKPDMPMIELLAPVDSKSPVVRTLKKVGVSPYHICYEVPSIKDAILKLREIQFIPLSEPVVADAISDGTICFLYNTEVGLIELLEIK